MSIFTEVTPNPRTLKFIPATRISAIPLDFSTAPDDDPMLQEIFGIGGVTRVHVGDTFVSVTVIDPDLWDVVKPSVRKAVHNGIKTFDPARYYPMNRENDVSDDDTEIVMRIKEAIETRVRPAVAYDGGDIVFGSFDGNTGLLRLSLRGACSDCPSSSATLKVGIQNLLSRFVPEVRVIERLR